MVLLKSAPELLVVESVVFSERNNIGEDSSLVHFVDVFDRSVQLAIFE